jgi:hypothetical protein
MHDVLGKASARRSTTLTILRLVPFIAVCLLNLRAAQANGAFNLVELALTPLQEAALTSPSESCQLHFEITSNPVVGGFVLDGAGFIQGTP